MGRGRAKAKQAKVARELKYHSGGSTDLDRLRAELAGQPVSTPVETEVVGDEDDEFDDPYAGDVDDADFEEDLEDEDDPKDHRTA
jgi:hypothetical protein